MTEIETVCLSPYFNKNCILIANMCTKCYEQCIDVKIVAVNEIFLKNSPVFDEEYLENVSRNVQKQTVYYKLDIDHLENVSDCKIKIEDFKDYVPIFSPPKSPHNLIEEELYHNPWQLLVATIFLNKTSCMSARPYIFEFLKEHPDPWKVLSKKPRDFERFFLKLGLQKTRSMQVWRMSHDFLYKNWNNVNELYGIGKYGEDAFNMFCLGDFGQVPDDRFLKIYRAWYLMEKREGNTKKEEAEA